VLTGKQLREFAKQHWTNALKCTDRKLCEEYKKLAESCEALADAQEATARSAPPNSSAGTERSGSV
jgi:hypothetical protein